MNYITNKLVTEYLQKLKFKNNKKLFWVILFAFFFNINRSIKVYRNLKKNLQNFVKIFTLKPFK